MLKLFVHVSLAHPGVSYVIEMWRLLVVSVVILCYAACFAQVESLFEPTWYGYDVGTYSTGRMSQASDMGDVDGDGDVDIVTSNNDPVSRNWSVTKNDGAGRFGPPTSYPGVHASAGIGLIDAEGDGDLDVLRPETSPYGQGTSVSLYRNSGAGVYAPRETLSGFVGPLGITVSDFDSDGRKDAAVANWGYFGAGNSVIVIYGDANGSFSRRLTLPGTNGMRQVESADLDLDGRMDIVVSVDSYGSSQTKLLVFYNNGNGFNSPNILDAAPETNWAGNTLSCIDIEEMTNDGLPDIVFSSLRTWNGSSGGVQLFRNLGNRQFAGKQYISYNYPSAGSTGIAAVDLDENGWKDIVATQFSDVYSGAVYVVMRDSQGGFGSAIPYPAGRGPYAVDIGDFNNDSLADVAATNYYSSEVSIHLNTGDGTLPAPSKYPTAPGGNIWIDFEDVDNDGDADALTSGGYCAVLLNNGDGSYGPFTTYNGEIGRPTGGGVLRDLNGDGNRDMLFADWNGPVGVLLYARWRPGIGNGTFGDIINTDIGFDNPGDVDAVDFDNDSDLDVVVSDPYRNAVQIGINDGFGNFSQSQVAMGVPAERFVFGDFNSDGFADIAACAYMPYGYDRRVSVVLANGNGGFGSPQVYQVDDWPMAIAAGDVNGDGRLDLATCNRGYENDPSPSVSVLLGNANGSFQPERRIVHSAVDQPLAIVIDDVDRDAKADLLVSNESNDVSFFKSRGDGTFDRHVRLGIGLVPNEFQYKDLSGDGIKDIGATCQTYLFGSNDVTVLKGASAPVSIFATQINIFRGFIVSGGLPQLHSSDDSRMVMQSGEIFTRLESNVDFTVEGTSTSQTPSSLSVSVESHATSTPLRQTIECFDFAAGNWVTVDGRQLNVNSDQAFTVNLSTPARFVQPGTKKVRLRFRVKPSGPVFVSSWQVKVDQLVWKALP